MLTQTRMHVPVPSTSRRTYAGSYCESPWDVIHGASVKVTMLHLSYMNQRPALGSSFASASLYRLMLKCNGEWMLTPETYAWRCIMQPYLQRLEDENDGIHILTWPSGNFSRPARFVSSREMTTFSTYCRLWIRCGAGLTFMIYSKLFSAYRGSGLCFKWNIHTSPTSYMNITLLRIG